MKRPTSCGKDGVPCGRAIKDSANDKFDDSVPPEKKQCPMCWNALNDPAYQRLWGLDGDDDGGRVDVAALPKKTGNCC